MSDFRSDNSRDFDSPSNHNINDDSVKKTPSQQEGHGQQILSGQHSRDLVADKDHQIQEDDVDEQKIKVNRKSRKRSSHQFGSHKRDSNTLETRVVENDEDSSEHQISEREEPLLDKRDHQLELHKEHSSSRRNLTRNRSSRRHLEKDASTTSRSGRKLVRESSSRRQRSSRHYEREDSSRRRSKHRRRSKNDDHGHGDDEKDKHNNVDDDETSDSAENEMEQSEREKSDERKQRTSHSHRQSRRRDRRSLSRHNKEGSRRSDSLRQNRSDSKRFKEEQRNPSIPSILPASSSQTQATFQFSELMESPTQSKKTKKQKSKRRKRKSLFSTRYICWGCCFISIVVVVAVTLILLQKRVAEPSANTLPRSFEPPSSADCTAISKGTFVTPKDKTNETSSPRRFQIDLQVELDEEDAFGNTALVSSRVKESMQIHLMPMLADCPENTRRLSGTHLDVWRRQLEGTSSLPQYIISNGVVASAMLNPNAVTADQVQTSQQRMSSRYLLLVIVDLWFQDEVQDGLVIDKILKDIAKLGQSAIFVSQVQIAGSVVLGVEAVSTLDDNITSFPTLSPTVAPSNIPSAVPTKIISRTPTSLPSLPPSEVPSGSPSAAPSGLPSTSPSLLPSSGPSGAPSTSPSSMPTAAPTSLPTRAPTSPPTTLSPTMTVTKTPITVDRSVDVIIVGAGAAGLTAAYHLEQQGLSVVLLEAANRYGGRMKQDSTSWDVSLGLGPEWLHVDNPNDMLSRIVGRTVNKQTIAEPNLAHRWTGTTLAYDPPGRWSGDYRWMGGTWWDFFDQELASNLQPDTVVLNSVVQTIDYEYQKPVVFLTNGRKYEGSYVIVTASVRTLQLGEINFIPSLPSSYTSAINNIEMDIAVKVFLEFTEKFYPDVFELDSDSDNYSSDCGSSRHGERLFYDPTVGRLTNTNILGMFTYANVADLYTGQEESAVIQTILNLLDQIFNGRASQTFVKGVVQDWASEPHIRTAYTKYGSSSYRQRLREPIDGKLYFAGEAVRTSGAGWGYVHGAAYCGKDVAEEIISRARG